MLKSSHHSLETSLFEHLYEGPFSALELLLHQGHLPLALYTKMLPPARMHSGIGLLFRCVADIRNLEL